MGVILSDLSRRDSDLPCNWWNWRPTTVILAQSGIIDRDRLERMQFNGGAAEVSADEARRIATYISAEVLPKLRDRDEVKLDGSVSGEPRWTGPISQAPSDEVLYGASREWLEMFAAYCRECGGFTVG